MTYSSSIPCNITHATAISPFQWHNVTAAELLHLNFGCYDGISSLSVQVPFELLTLTQYSCSQCSNQRSALPSTPWSSHSVISYMHRFTIICMLVVTEIPETHEYKIFSPPLASGYTATLSSQRFPIEVSCIKRLLKFLLLPTVKVFSPSTHQQQCPRCIPILSSCFLEIASFSLASSFIHEVPYNLRPIYSS